MSDLAHPYSPSKLAHEKKDVINAMSHHSSMMLSKDALSLFVCLFVCSTLLLWKDSVCLVPSSITQISEQTSTAAKVSQCILPFILGVFFVLFPPLTTA
jgi:hypothetical protein